ncbi:MAG: peptidylprolyl isomerase [Campylobacteraceae bacterium]|nr:peptidylprolyl isomerase [Campylobacteraceae bacterium]
MNLKTYDYTKDELSAFAYAIIKTNKGDMTLKLYPKEAPITVANFAYLVKSGFYDSLTFHRVIPNFVIQGGCPNGTGSGGPGWKIECECDKNIHKHQRGTLSMAHAGRNTGGSQFFICHSKQSHLDGVHTVFGDIINENSLKVLDNIKASDIIKTIEIKQNI